MSEAKSGVMTYRSGRRVVVTDPARVAEEIDRQALLALMLPPVSMGMDSMQPCPCQDCARLQARHNATDVLLNAPPIVPSQQTVAAALKSVMMDRAIATLFGLAEALRQQEQDQREEAGCWLVTPSDLRETRKGKGLGSGEVMGWGGYEDE